MAKVNQPETLGTQVRELRRRITALERGHTLAGATISQGALEVRTVDGVTIMRAGELSPGVYGLATYRHDGTLQAQFFDTAAGGGYWAMFDEAGNTVMSDDTVSGVGLAAPYLALSATPSSEVLVPPVTTTSATFVDLHRITGPKQQPSIHVRLLTVTDVGTTGEVILVQGGVQIGPTLPLPAADNTYRSIVAPVAGAHMSDLIVDVQARRTAGAGNVRVGVAYQVGRQS